MTTLKLFKLADKLEYKYAASEQDIALKTLNQIRAAAKNYISKIDRILTLQNSWLNKYQSKLSQEQIEDFKRKISGKEVRFILNQMTQEPPANITEGSNGAPGICTQYIDDDLKALQALKGGGFSQEDARKINGLITSYQTIYPDLPHTTTLVAPKEPEL